MDFVASPKHTVTHIPNTLHSTFINFENEFESVAIVVVVLVSVCVAGIWRGSKGLKGAGSAGAARMMWRAYFA